MQSTAFQPVSQSVNPSIRPAGRQAVTQSVSQSMSKLHHCSSKTHQPTLIVFRRATRVGSTLRNVTWRRLSVSAIGAQAWDGQSRAGASRALMASLECAQCRICYGFSSCGYWENSDAKHQKSVRSLAFELVASQSWSFFARSDAGS